VSPEDDFFSPRNREYFFRGMGSNPRKRILSWCPSAKGALNARLDYLSRVLECVLGREMPRDQCVEVLARLWNDSLALHEDQPGSCWREYFSSASLGGGDVAYRLRHNFWELRAPTIDPDIQWFHCATCNNLTLHNIRGVCPTYQCSGELRRADPEEVFKDNHYRRLYTSLEPIALVAEEHTAQLTSEAAAELQTQFMEGRVNVLSCSTTFELGVDVGQLESVFMRNVPPTAANYVQRAGRAGRRTSAAAFALTFAQRRPHDLAHFNEPIRMISGEIRPPYFEIANEKIVRRHVYAAALAAFWKEQRDTFGNVSSFFFREGRNGPDLLRDYLATRPEALRESLKRIVPSGLQERVGIAEWGWVDGLLGDEGVLTMAARTVVGDVQKLEEARQELIRRNRPSDFILKIITTIKEAYLINFLSSHNVIPKYGFPVDVVALQVLHHAEEARDLELTRDLRIALSEYAPSSQVVARGKLWTSRYIKRLPDRGWRRYRYAICRNCRCYQRVLADTQEPLETCRACGYLLEGRDQGTFIVPEFGFITSNDPPSRPGESRPERTYTTRPYFAGEWKEVERLEVELNGRRITAIAALEGRVAVINHAGYQGFKVCHSCGYAVLGGEKTSESHRTPWHTECRGSLSRFFLGHEFLTDVLQIHIDGYADERQQLWYSLLYGILEGMSAAMDIERQDLDGCLYAYAGDLHSPALVLFDNVPGGAGHVRRVVEDREALPSILEATLDLMQRCDCGGEQQDTSCYGCLRNYGNQFCHDLLSRGLVIDFLQGELGLGIRRL